jgi:hypothetical protein
MRSVAAKRYFVDKILFGSVSPAGERSLHTGEVAGSIPAAPTIFQALLGSIWQLLAERYGNARAQSGRNPGDMFTVRFIEGEGQIERDNRADCACDDLLAGRQDRRAQQSRDAMRCAAKEARDLTDSRVTLDLLNA